jgi:hypothetical protein
MRTRVEPDSSSAQDAHYETPVLNQPLKEVNQKYTRWITRLIFLKRVPLFDSSSPVEQVLHQENTQHQESNRKLGGGTQYKAYPDTIT